MSAETPRQPEESQPMERRSFIRVYVKVNQENQLMVVREDGRQAPVRLVDISIGGARIELVNGFAAEPPLRENAFFEGVDVITFKDCRQEPFGEQLEGQRARVVWHRDSQAGVLFDALLG